MNNPRANIANLIAAGGAALLILSLFIGWFDVGADENWSGWKTFSLADIVLLVIGLVTLALAGAHIAGRAATLPGFLRPSVLKWLGTIALTIALLFTIELTSGQFEADMKIGAILAVLASAAILAGGILNDRPELAARLNEATAGIGSGGGGAGGPGGTPQSPGASAQGFPGGQPGGQPGGVAASPGPSPSAEPQQPASPPQEPAAAQPQTAPQPVESPSPAAQPAQAESSGPAPGWYPDPQGQKRLRYWDGSRWTEQTAD